MARSSHTHVPPASPPPLPTSAEQADDQAELIRGFDPVDLSLEQIETLQALLKEAAAAKRALRDHPAADHDVAFVSEAEAPGVLEGVAEEDETATYYRAEGETRWDMLDEVGLEEQRRIDEAVAQVKAERAREAERMVTATPLLLEGANDVPLPAELDSAAPKRRRKAPPPRT